MTTLQAKELKLNNMIEVQVPEICGYQTATKLSGVVQQIYDQGIGGERYKFIQVLDVAGKISSAYLKLTEEVMEVIMTPEIEKKIVKHRIQNLPRVVGTQGSDPEIFAVDKDNQVIPAFRFLGSKESPDRCEQNNEPIFWDGYQAEFNVYAQSCLDGTITSTWQSLRSLDRLLKKHDKDARLTIQPTFDIPMHLLKTDKEEHVQFGCMPSKNVYEMKGKVADGRDVPFRSSGGHIHLALNEEQKKKIPQYVKALDAILGVASVSMFGQYDESRRREYYGLAGEYRTPKHGMEYRPLSNVWMCHPTAMYITFEFARKIISLVDNDLFKYWNAREEDVIACINDCNIPLACEIIKQNEEMFKDLLASFCYKDKDKIQVVYNTYMTGIESLIDNVDDVFGNWKLGGQRDYEGRISNLHNNPNFKKLLEVKF